MKFYLLSDNSDTLTGLRLAGVEGELVNDLQGLQPKIMALVADKSIGILLISPSIMSREQDFINNIKLHNKTPLILEVPQPGKRPGASSGLEKFVSDAIGINIF